MYCVCLSKTVYMLQTDEAPRLHTLLLSSLLYICFVGFKHCCALCLIKLFVLYIVKMEYIWGRNQNDKK